LLKEQALGIVDEKEGVTALLRSLADNDFVLVHIEASDEPSAEEGAEKVLDARSQELMRLFFQLV
jgi:2,3-bisphosphoglycerate-independent phosphoglycerate mutase